MYTRFTRSHIHADLASSTYFWLRIIKIIILPCISAYALPHTRETLIPLHLGVRNYLNNYSSMYKHLKRFPYMRGTHIPRLLWVSNYLNNYFAMYKRLMRSRIQVHLVAPAYLGLSIIKIIIFPRICVSRAPIYTRTSHPPPTSV